MTKQGSRAVSSASSLDRNEEGKLSVSPAGVCKDPPNDAERRHRMIAEAAFFVAERRGFASGCELDDWLTAEVEIDTALAQD